MQVPSFYFDKMEKESEKADHGAVFFMAQVLKMDIFIVTCCQEERRKYVVVKGAENSTGQPLLLGHDVGAFDDEGRYRKEGDCYRSLGPYKGMYATHI